MKSHKKLYLAIATIASTLAGNNSLQAAEETENEEAAASAQYKDLEEVVVTASYRQSLQNALENKRNADSIVDGISAEGISAFPDLNLGESLQRVTGVQINRSNSNPNNSPRDASINLRGLPNSFSRTLINGVPFADPVDSGGTSFGVFQSDLFSGLDVIKAPTALTPEGGLSGVINMKTARPLDLEDGAMVATLKGVFEELTEDQSPIMSFSGSKHFLEERLGVSFALISAEEHYRRDTSLVTRYSALTDEGGEAVTMPDGGRIYYPGQMRQIVSSYDGDSLGASSVIQYRFNDTLETSLSVLYAERDLDRPFDLWVVSDQSSTQVTALSEPVFAGRNGSGEPEYVINDVSLTNIDTTQGPRPGHMEDDMLNINWDLNWKGDNWRAKGIAGYSEGTNITRTIQYDYRYGGENGLIANMSTGGSRWEDFSVDVTDANNNAFADVNSLENTTGNYVIVPPHVLEAESAIGGYNRLIIADTDSEIQSDMVVLNLEFERFLNWGVLSSLEFGSLYTSGTEKSRVQRQTVLGIENLSTAFINNDLVTDVHYLDGASFMGGEVSTLNNWLSLDGDLIESRLQPVTVPEGYVLGTAGWVVNPYDGAVINGNYTADTDVLSLYSQLNFEGNIGVVPFRANLGLRYVETAIDFESWRNNQDAIEIVHTSNDYNNLLPAANLSLELHEDLMLRAAYSETFVRPLARDNSPSQAISVIIGEDPNPIRARLGSADLEPYQAQSYDLSLEWYNRPGGIVALATFQKEIDGFISTVNICPADGAGLGLGPLTGTGITDSSGVFDCFTGDGTGIIVSQPQNSADTIKVTGTELSIQQNLDFLPGFWSGFGGVFNYSIIDISGKINGAEARLNGVSEKNYNLIGFYENDTFSVRLAYNWRDEYELGSGGTFSGAARSVADRGQLDASTSFKVTDSLALSLEAFNLTQEPLVEFEGTKSRPRRTDYDGRTFILAARYVF